MFDFENPFKTAIDTADDIEDGTYPTEEMVDATGRGVKSPKTPDWENADWEDVCNNPQHQAEGDRRAARAAAMENQCEAMEARRQKDQEELFSNFYEKEHRRRKERILIDALRYAGLALGCGLLTYFCIKYSISWLAWVLGCGSAIFGLTASYDFGIAHEMGR